MLAMNVLSSTTPFLNMYEPINLKSAHYRVSTMIELSMLIVWTANRLVYISVV